MSTTYYSSSDELNSTSVSIFQDMTFRDLTGMDVEQVGCLEGLADYPIKNVTFENVQVRSYQHNYFINAVENIKSSDSRPEPNNPNAEKCFI